MVSDEIDWTRRAPELPDDIRVPLHSLQADREYLVARIRKANDEEAELLSESIRNRLSQIEEAAYRLNAIAAMSSWRDVKTDPPPRDGTEVLLYGELIVDNDGMPNDGRQIGTERTVGWWDDGQWETDDPYVRCTPTHWMPLPPVPEAHNEGR